MSQLEFFATCPKSLESLLLDELKELGASDSRETVAGVYFSGDPSLLYRACLWSRLANKILLPLAKLSASNEANLYKEANAIAWENHFPADCTFRVDFLGTDKVIRNSQFGAVRIKDAIVDRFQQREGQRPSVERSQPQIIINARLSKGQVHLSLDLSGHSLHRRGYRLQQGEAPIKENLAVALLLRAGWPQVFQEGGHLIDPMCGSATLLIEGLLMAADYAPGLLREKRKDMHWGFEFWQQFDRDSWDALLDEAKERRIKGLAQVREGGIEFRGYDQDWRVLQAANSNIEFCGLENFVKVMVKSVTELKKPTHKVLESGLVICNPPYGERLSEEKELLPVYQDLGQALKQEFVGWQAAVITSNVELAKQIGLQAKKKYKFWNGTLAAELLCFSLEEKYFRVNREQRRQSLQKEDLSEGAVMVYNRLLKNQKQLKKWLKNNGVSAYRLYDADLPEYAAAVDVYGDAVHVQEYAAPKSIDEGKARQRLNELLDALTIALQVSSDQLFLKQRKKQKGKSQYTAQNDIERDMLQVQEYKASFLIDLWTYLDSGLFLDHRPVRRWIAENVRDKSFLNLFCYTATASVQAALAGAKESTSVDMSKTYLDWAGKNFDVNHINPYRHQLVQADCLAWLQQCRQGFDMVLLDPPSFSNSKRMESVLDIQQDHTILVDRCMDLLNPGGTLIFSNNLRSFTLDAGLQEKYHIENITEKTLDPDFQRNHKIHQCWLIRHP